MTTVAPDISTDFSQSGYVVLRNFLQPEVVEGARRALTRLVDLEAEKLIRAGKITDPLAHEPFETRLYRLYEGRLAEAPLRFRPELHLPELFDVFFDPRLLDVVAQLLGDEILLYPNYTTRPKFPDFKRGEVLWHQDGGYTDAPVNDGCGLKVEQLRMVNVWTALVPAHVEHGCMQFIPGTHKIGSVPHAIHPQFRWLEIAPEFLKPRLSSAVNIEMDPGDVVLFHNMLFHQGLPNRSKIVRWNLDWRYLDATQPTLRKQKGHLAQSRRDPSNVVVNADDWARRQFG